MVGCIYIYIYSICTPPQYLTCGRIEIIRECLETRSDKPISSNSLCDLASFILKNNYFENEELKYHQKKKVLLLGPSSLLHTLACLWKGYKTELFKTVNLNVVTLP